MTENLGSWQRLLQLTGGDIDLEKSQWSLLSWSYVGQWGTPQINSNAQSLGELIMTSPIDDLKVEEKLSRLEPQEADRVLGVRLPLDGSMGVEYEYRKSQLIDFALKLKNAPLSHYDAYVVYESRYRAMIKYPLPVTQFTKKQCHNLQRPVINSLLPKMGLNRKMPRAVIYGPMSLGGRELMDLRIEQVTSQWDATRGHLCRDDRVGHGLRLSLRDHQCIIGSEKLFLNVDPEIYKYGMENTRWRYIWTNVWDNDLEVNFYDAWVPTSSCVNDRNIMDVAVQDEIVIKSKWDLLEHINRCRLYLKAFFISDLSDDGTNADIGYLQGTKSRHNIMLNIPDVRRPTDAQWRVWKSFIFRNFLSPGLTINPPIRGSGEGHTRMVKKPTEVESIEKLYGHDGSLQEILSMFPTEMHPLIGEISIPTDGGLQLSHSIVEGECMGASDGSLLKEFHQVRGGFGYALSQFKSDDNSVHGIGVCPKADEMSSQTSEHQGLLGLLCVLHAMCIKYKLCKEERWGTVIIVIDNKNVVERAENEQHPYNIGDFQVPDQDLWALTTELIRSLPIHIRCQWIKGHGDVNARGEVVYGPFKRETQLNIWTDELATEGLRRSDKKQISRPTFSTTKMMLQNKEGESIHNLRRYLLRSINGEELLDYYRIKKGWHSRVFNQIDWEALESLIRKANPIKKNRHIQVLHDWQNVGRQKGKLRDARLSKKVEPELQATVEEVSIHLCPNGCGEAEGHLHYVKCQRASAMEERERLRNTALARLKRLRTSECMCSYIGYILKKISLDETIALDDDVYRTEDERDLIPALLGQQEIGWEELLKGFAHKGWSSAQRRYYQREGLTSKIFSVKRWKRMFLTILTDYSNDCWKLRNEAVHGVLTKEGRVVKKARLVEQVRCLYKKKKELSGTPLRKVFNMSVEKRVRQGVHSLILWIGKAEEVLKLHREESDKTTIDRWIGCR